MRVFSNHWPSNQPLTSPFPIKDGIVLAIRSGDLCSPDDWKVPVRVRRAYVYWRPFLSFRKGHFGFYIGWKVFGVDNEDLKKFSSINPSEVYVGSLAMQGFTWRFTTKLGA